MLLSLEFDFAEFCFFVNKMGIIMPQEAGSIIISLFNRKGKQLSVSSVVDLFSANTTCRS